MQGEMRSDRLRRAVRRAVWEEIRTALEETGGEREAVADALGLSRRALYRLLERWDLLGEVRLWDAAHGRRDWWPGAPRDGGVTILVTHG